VRAPERHRARQRPVRQLIETKRPRDYDLTESLPRHPQALADRQEASAALRKRFGELPAQQAQISPVVVPLPYH
jgi:hypothetical protein